MDLSGKRVLLTGATGGIGQAFALALAKSGAILIMVSRSGPALEGWLALAERKREED